MLDKCVGTKNILFRQGLYFLFGWNQQDEGEKYPSYYKPGSKQYLYFMHELQSWEYWHSYDRWIIGPEHNKAIGGIMIKPWDPSVVCPWDIKWFRSHRWYHDVNIPNHWNPKGNPWRPDDSIFVHCYEEEDWLVSEEEELSEESMVTASTASSVSSGPG